MRTARLMMTGILGGGNLRYQNIAKALYDLAYWELGEAAGATSALDSSGHGYTGTVGGTVTFGEAGYGDQTAAKIDGAGRINVFSAGLAAAINPNAWTVGALVKFDSGALMDVANRRIFQFTGDASNLFYLGKSSTWDKITGAYTAGGTAKTADDTNISNRYAGRVHIGVTCDKTADQLQLYIAGQPWGSPTTGLGTWAGAITLALIGARTATNLDSHDGWLQHAGVASRALTAAEMARLDPIRRKLIVFEGDSRTVGTGAAVYNAYPSQVMRSLGVTGDYKAANIGTSGQQVAHMLTQIESQIAPLADPGLGRVAVLFAGVNDGATETAETIYNRIASWHTQVRALGYKTVCCTEIDAQDAARNANNWHSTVYPALNTMLRNDHSFADGFADLGGAAELQDATNVTYFADLIHPTAAGYTVIAGLVATAIAALP